MNSNRKPPVLAPEDLTNFFWQADQASQKAQHRTVNFNLVRLVGAIVAAAGAGVDFQLKPAWHSVVSPLFGLVALGFAGALVAELLLLVDRPERDWYAGRALAESAKTLAWRFAVHGDPFLPSLNLPAARALMRERVQQVAEMCGDRIVISGSEPVVTASMENLRESTFDERRAAYVEFRTAAQRDWYRKKADTNGRRAFRWRLVLIGGEVVAVALATGQIFNKWHWDPSGWLAAFVASGAAWVGLKQYTALASAYTVAANELALITEGLRDIAERDWPEAVADAEDAISREHTSWLASRSSSLDGHRVIRRRTSP
jgi:SMODS and SLOG-associating 2TM effector domain 3/SMODS and SLOG-associating 2TM effector domain 1